LKKLNKIIISKFNSKEELENQLSGFIYETLKKKISKFGNSSIALSGGETPLNLYSNLSRKRIDWGKIDLSLVDERLAGPKSKDSNQRNILESLSLDSEQLRTFNSFEFTLASDGEPRLNKGAVHYNLPFDICLLGMGQDGHFASIFPNVENIDYLLDKKNTELVSIVKSKEKIPYRFTMTFRAISQSEHIILYVNGEEKLSLIEKILDSNLSSTEYPIKKVFDEYEHDLKIYWCN
tara:strand:+ start:38010 stop:38717 length:708 start_codon:yes stop_codon:yes gene_type:complete